MVFPRKQLELFFCSGGLVVNRWWVRVCMWPDAGLRDA
jgi:hypothetical protein